MLVNERLDARAHPLAQGFVLERRTRRRFDRAKQKGMPTYVQCPRGVDVAVGFDGDGELLVVDVQKVVGDENDAMLVIRRTAAVQFTFEQLNQ